jgi:ribosomal-protein-alanine N-acetyltransferase
MSAVALPCVSMAPMRDLHLDEVMRIEQSVYEFPWTRRNFTDAMEVGYRCRVASAPPSADIIGHAVLMQVIDEVHLLNLAVAAGHQNRGLGRSLLRSLYAELQAAGAVSMTLEVRPTNEAARHLYASEGFLEVGRRRDYYPARGGREDALLLTRVLA